jgi:hypothetical protein
MSRSGEVREVACTITLVRNHETQRGVTEIEVGVREPILNIF